MHKDPAPREMGWGRKTHNIAQTMAIEKMTLDKVPIRCAAKDSVGATSIDPTIEKAIRAKFKFDEGWDFMVAERIVYGLKDDETWMVPQLIGNCVGDSHCGLITARYAHEILAEGDAEEPLGKRMLGSPFIPYSYGVGRMEGDMLGPGDGSYCGAQMQGTLKYGFLPCFTEGLDRYAGPGDAALPQGTAQANRLFGSSRREIEKWTAKASKFAMKEAPVATNADEAWDLMVNKKIPLQICSGQGFAYWKFDTRYGVHLYRPSGTWSHSMQLVVAFVIKGQRFRVIRNQWGLDAHKGSPEIGIPGGCMVIAEEDFARWIRDSEVMGIGEIDGLPTNPGF